MHVSMCGVHVCMCMCMHGFACMCVCMGGELDKRKIRALPQVVQSPRSSPARGTQSGRRTAGAGEVFCLCCLMYLSR